MRTELVAALVAMTAGGDNIRSVSTSIFLGDQVLASCLQTRRLTQGQAVRDREAAVIHKPHRQIAVIAKATLTMEGSITSGSIVLSHDDVQMSEGIPVASYLRTRRCLEPIGYAGTTPGG